MKSFRKVKLCWEVKLKRSESVHDFRFQMKVCKGKKVLLFIQFGRFLAKKKRAFMPQLMKKYVLYIFSIISDFISISLDFRSSTDNNTNDDQPNTTRNKYLVGKLLHLADMVVSQLDVNN